MTLDETRPLCIMLHAKHADVLIRRIIVCLYSLVPAIIRTCSLLYPNVLALSLAPLRVLNCLCSPVPQLKLTMFHCSKPSRIVWVHLTNTTLYLQVGLTTLEPHVLSAICSYSFEPHVRFVLEITSKMTWCSARPRRVQICNEGVSF